MSSSIPLWQILTAHALPFRGARDLAFCLKVPLDALLIWASSEGSGETARMRRLAWTFAARIGYKYQIGLTRSIYKMSRDMTKPTKWLCSQRRLGSAWASTQSDQSSLRVWWVAKDPSFLHADSEDSDQIGQMPRLIWVFAGHILILVLWCCGSNNVNIDLLYCVILYTCRICQFIPEIYTYQSFFSANLTPNCQFCCIWFFKNNEKGIKIPYFTKLSQRQFITQQI